MSEHGEEPAEPESSRQYDAHGNTSRSDLINLMARVERLLQLIYPSPVVDFEHDFADWFYFQEPSHFPATHQGRIPGPPATQVMDHAPVQVVSNPIGATAADPRVHYDTALHYHRPMFLFGQTSAAPAYLQTGFFAPQAGGATHLVAPLPQLPGMGFVQPQHVFAPQLPVQVEHEQRLYAQHVALEAETQRLGQRYERVMTEQRWLREQIEARIATEERRNEHLSRLLNDEYPNEFSDQSEYETDDDETP